MYKKLIFTSESVSEGHPDKICDQISDAIVDAFLVQDPYSKVRAECSISSAIIFIPVRYASSGYVDLAQVARKVIMGAGYDEQDFNPKTCSIITAPKELAINPEDTFDEHQLTDDQISEIFVKNQVTVFGFACSQTPVLLPFPIWMAHRIAYRYACVQKEKKLSYLVPDGKVQVGIEYKNRKPYRIHSITVTASQQSGAFPDAQTLYDDVKERIILPAFNGNGNGLAPDGNTRIFVNPDGPFFGGPNHHSGLTGRKNAIDTYGEYARHSGKALSGKDPMRVDRIGAYAARYAAKNVVAAGLAEECEIMLSYAIGATWPISLAVDTRQTGRLADAKLTQIVAENFDFRLMGILRDFDLRRLPAKHVNGFYQKLAAYGHFGREDMDLPWEKTDKAEILKKYLKA